MNKRVIIKPLFLPDNCTFSKQQSTGNDKSDQIASLHFWDKLSLYLPAEDFEFPTILILVATLNTKVPSETWEEKHQDPNGPTTFSGTRKHTFT